MNEEVLDATVRFAAPGDAPGIANVHLNSWKESYQGLIPDDYLNRLPLSFHQRMKTWDSLIRHAPPGRAIWVAENKRHGVVGFSTVEKARDEKFSSYGELGAIYMLNQYKGKGIGYNLLKAAMSHLKNEGFKKAYCWILKDNPTMSFYKKTGATITDEIKKEKISNFEATEQACIWNNLENFK